ncbi:MAG TPA: hypothetical protein VFI11_07080 [Anaerolineales bacterium]|nr:hypothetical protein [Anaerolineales bacterium]
MSAYPAQAQRMAEPLDLAGGLRRALKRIPHHRGFVFGSMLLGAMLAFEAFNFGTTQYALGNLVGDLRFGPVAAASLLALAFCGIDFAGIARLLTPGRGRHQPAEVWYLLLAWILAATMNATLTWWAVSVALLDQGSVGNEILGREALLRAAPTFVALLVWLIRVLMIGALTLAGGRIFSFGEDRAQLFLRPIGPRRQAPVPSQARPAPKPVRPTESSPAFASPQ